MIESFGQPRVLGAMAATAVFLILGTISLIKNANPSSRRYFAYFNFSLALWNVGEIFIIFIPRHPTLALALDRISYFGAIAFIPCYLKMMRSLATHLPPRPRLLAAYRIFFIAGVILSALLVTPLIIKDVSLPPLEEIPGPFFFLFPIYCIGGLTVGLFHLFYVYTRSSGEEQLRIKYFSFALGIGGIAAANYFLTFLRPSTPSFYHPLEIIYGLITGYAILKYRLLDITVVVRQTLLYSMTTAILLAIYIVVLTLITHLIERWGSFSGLYAGTITTAIIALLSHPLFIRLQHFIDAYFPRHSLDPRLLREATSGFAHEMKRPLTAIALPAELGLNDIADFRAAKSSADVMTAKVEKRLKTILDTSLDLGMKIEALRALAEPTTEPFTEISLRQMISDILQAQKAQIDHWGIRVNLEMAASCPPVLGLLKQTELALLNLVTNAIEALAEVNGPRELIFNVTSEGTAVVLKIQDNGVGIVPEQRTLLFKPFFTTKGSKGTGIGLYLTRQLLEHQQATITLEPDISPTIFKITFHTAK